MFMMFFRQRRLKQGVGELIKKNAPDYCEVTIVHDGKKVQDCQQESELAHPSQESSPQRTGLNSERNFFQCVCFTGKSNWVCLCSSVHQCDDLEGNYSLSFYYFISSKDRLLLDWYTLDAECKLEYPDNDKRFRYIRSVSITLWKCFICHCKTDHLSIN